ncbi:hypothetical protein EGW08_013411 [Elysia chlorotica]|uniref:Uncharacterized protein n=1 Tax=Elysia chlorotica TaxID=188477 RepID=A0A3S0ZN57_ELYCH|nr:hypothetical protein EGW08_013411 [Elysia chlorotica]
MDVPHQHQGLAAGMSPPILHTRNMGGQCQAVLPETLDLSRRLTKTAHNAIGTHSARSMQTASGGKHSTLAGTRRASSINTLSTRQPCQRQLNIGAVLLLLPLLLHRQCRSTRVQTTAPLQGIYNTMKIYASRVQSNRPSPDDSQRHPHHTHRHSVCSAAVNAFRASYFADSELQGLRRRAHSKTKTVGMRICTDVQSKLWPRLTEPMSCQNTPLLWRYDCVIHSRRVDGKACNERKTRQHLMRLY